MEINNITEKIRVDGVDCKGYGLVYKFVMLDTELSAESKAIYAYLCSFAGNKTTAFPSRDKILRDLNLSKNGYYRHYNQLIKQGYIRVVKSGGIFSKNTYVLEKSPEKLRGNADVQNLKGCGYGFIPKAVMLDERLDIKAKAIYAYLASFGGSGKTAHPKQAIMLYHLQMCQNTFYTYYNQLLELNYITAEKQRNANKYAENRYRLNEYPGAEQVIKNEDTRIKDMKTTHLKNEDTTNINRRNMNNININSKSSSHVGKFRQSRPDPAMLEEEIQNIKASLNYDVAVCNFTQSETAEVDKSIEFIAEILASDNDVFLIGNAFFRKNDFKSDLKALNCSDLTQIWQRIRNAAKPIINIKNYVLSSINNQCIKNKLQPAEKCQSPENTSSFNIYEFFDKAVARAIIE
jgi:DNA-binding transcriptional regulator YhcF (GntR family)